MAKHDAIYVRVSTRRQDLASQLPDLERWARGQDGPVEWYRDKFTGKTMDRPGWEKLWNAVGEGRVSRVVVWRVDRLGRTAKGLTALFDELRQMGVDLVSLKDHLDLSTPAGRLMAHVLASVAAYETEVRAERTIAGQAVARAKGVKFGRPPGPGIPTKVDEEKRAEILRMKAQGYRVASIARLIGLTRTTVYKVLAEG